MIHLAHKSNSADSVIVKWLYVYVCDGNSVVIICVRLLQGVDLDGI